MKSNTMTIINFYSYKGGVGRTMSVSQIARLLAARGKKVVVADFDFDAPGVPAVFGMKFQDVREGGLFELFTDFSDCDDNDDAFKKRLGSCLIDVKNIKLIGDDKNGSISILPSGCVNNKYWEGISSPKWIDSISSTEQRSNSFLRFVMKKLKPALETMFDYLLIDSRAGVTYYGSIGQYVATRQAMIFCPNNEAKDALHTFLLPALEKSQEKRKKAYDDDKECGIDPEKFPLERVVFVVSRMPPELNEKKEKVFNEIKDLIRTTANKLADQTYTKTLKLHSDLETHLEPQCRTLNESYFKDDTDVVQIHEDILMILVALCPEVFPDNNPDTDVPGADLLKKQAEAVWREIFKKPFRITYENRLFGFLFSGIMRNPDDNNRNIAFKVDTFLGFLNNFYDTLLSNSQIQDHVARNSECTRVMNEALGNTGRQCGVAFGKDLVKLWKDNKEKYGEFSYNNLKQNINRWCDFDTRAGFGKMSYVEKDKTSRTLEVKNIFILKPEVTGVQREYTAFFTGYATGVLEILTGQAICLSKPDVNNIENSVTYQVSIGVQNSARI